MGLGTSQFLIAPGAVLRFAVSVTTHGFNLHRIGIILIIVGIIGLLVSVLWMSVWADRRRGVTAVRSREVPLRETEWL